MIRVVARCPYCGRVSTRLDDAGPDLVMRADRGGSAGCRHLAFLSVGLEALDPAGERADDWTRVWLWVRGTGLRLVPDGQIDNLVEYVDLTACQIPVVGEDPPEAEYRIGGMTAGARERDRPGTGEIRLRAAGGRELVGIFDGWGLYSTAPGALVQEVRRLSKRDGPDDRFVLTPRRTGGEHRSSVCGSGRRRA